MPERFEREMDALKRKLLEMGALAEEMIQKASLALTANRADMTREVLNSEKEINRYHREIDDDVIRMIGVYTPVASSLRFLLMAARINGELERVGDQAENICENTDHRLKDEACGPLVDIPRMSELVLNMLRGSLDSFTSESVEKAIEVMKLDDEVDDMNDRNFRVLITHMMEDNKTIGCCMQLILATRSLERVADLAVDIAENVVYLVKGEDVRHVKGLW